MELQTVEQFKAFMLDNNSPMIDKIFMLEDFLIKNVKTSQEEAENLPVDHHLCDGQYAREIFIPANHVVTGRVHKFDHISVISRGKITVATPEGMSTYEAPITFASKKGTKRAAYAHEDTLWTTFHCTNKTNIDDIVDELTFNNIEDCKKLIKEN